MGAAASATAWPPNLLALGWQQLPCAKGTVIFNTTILSPATHRRYYIVVVPALAAETIIPHRVSLQMRNFFYDCLIWEFCMVIATTTTPFY